MPLQMPQVGQGMNPLIMRALMSPQQGMGGPQLPQAPQRPSGMNSGGGYTMTAPSPQQPAQPGVGGMMQNPMQMAMMGAMLKGNGASLSLPSWLTGSGGAQAIGTTPYGTAMMAPNVAGGSMFGGGMQVGGGLGQPAMMTQFPAEGGLGAYNFGGGGGMITNPAFGGTFDAAGAWSPAGWGAGTSVGAGALGGADSAAFTGGAWLGGDAALGAGMGAGALGAGGGAALAGGGAAEGIGATIAANPELWALAFA